MRTIDADRLNAVVNETLETLVMLPVFSLQEVHLKTAFETLTDMINDAPTIDAVQVVRCCECKYYGEMLPNADNRMICHKFALNFDNDFFCKNGERRTDETD